MSSKLIRSQRPVHEVRSAPQGRLSAEARWVVAVQESFGQAGLRLLVAQAALARDDQPTPVDQDARVQDSATSSGSVMMQRRSVRWKARMDTSSATVPRAVQRGLHPLVPWQSRKGRSVFLILFP